MKDSLEFVTSLWERVLEVDDIDADDDFFVLGGNSLRMVQIVAEAHRRTGVSMPLGLFLQDPTPRAHAAYVDAETGV
jgi:acyl carrier protein